MRSVFLTTSCSAWWSEASPKAAYRLQSRPTTGPLVILGADHFKRPGNKAGRCTSKCLDCSKTGQAIDAKDFAIWYKKLQTSLPGLDLLGIQEADEDFAAWFSVLERFYNQMDPQDGPRLIAHIGKQLATTEEIVGRENSAAAVHNDSFPYQLIHRKLVLDLESD